MSGPSTCKKKSGSAQAPSAEARTGDARFTTFVSTTAIGDSAPKTATAPLDLHLVRARPLVPRDRALERRDGVVDEEVRPAVALLGSHGRVRLALTRERRVLGGRRGREREGEERGGEGEEEEGPARRARHP